MEISPANPIFSWFYEIDDIPIHRSLLLYLNIAFFGKQSKVFQSLDRTLALRAKGRRFKSGPAHHSPFLLVEEMLFSELHVENCVIRCFKWFSKVLLRLKPRAFDFATRSLSKYNTKFLLVVIANASARIPFNPVLEILPLSLDACLFFLLLSGQSELCIM